MKDEEIKEKNKINLHLPNKKKVQKLEEKGITLIALVVTIILLLILAGVTISQIAGSNGLFQRARQAVEKYKNAAEEEQIQIGMLEQYVSDFSVVVGGEGEDKASVEIKTFTVEGNPKEQTIKVNLTIEGEASKIQLSIDNGKTWVPSEEEKLEETEGEYTYTFEGLDLGKSYYVRVKVYDEQEKYVEAISDIVTLSNSITAVESDVLSPKTYLAEDGSVKTGTMPDIGVINETLSAGGEKTIPAGYTSGGKITVKTLREQTPGDATAEQILNTKKAWVNGNQVTGSMKNNSGKTVTASSVTTNVDYTQFTIPEAGYYDTNSKIEGLNSNISKSNGIPFFINRAHHTPDWCAAGIALYVNGNKYLTIDNVYGKTNTTGRTDIGFWIFGTNDEFGPASVITKMTSLGGYDINGTFNYGQKSFEISGYKYVVLFSYFLSTGDGQQQCIAKNIYVHN